MGKGLALIDAGAIYLRAIFRRCAELGAKPTVLPLGVSTDILNEYDAAIVSGSGYMLGRDQVDYNPAIFDGKRPTMGLCFGQQLMNVACGGTVKSAMGGIKEYGRTYVKADPSSALFARLDPIQRVLMSHGDSVDRLAPGFRAIAHSNGLIAAIENPQMRQYAVQFHPEMVPITKHGKDMFERFLFDIAHLPREKETTVDDLVADSFNYIRERVGAGDKKVFMLLSGGVDSTVALKLVSEAIGSRRIYGGIIDTGLMRENEPEEVYSFLSSLGLGNIQLVRAAQDFYNAAEKEGSGVLRMGEVTDSEVKRRLFRGVYKSTAIALINAKGANLEEDWVVQGTLAPDIAESGIGRGLIKTHHNVKLGFNNELTPLQYFHKDQVRAAARLLGLPESIASREPFPGPGLLVRTVCADRPFMDEQYDSTSESVQALARSYGLNAAVLPIQTVGIQGDERTYTYPALLWGNKDWDSIDELAGRIPREIHTVNRVEYLLSPPPSSITPKDWITPTKINPETIEPLRKADAKMRRLLERYGLSGRVAQVPGCMLPLNLGVSGARLFSLRPLFTPDFYAGTPGRIAQDVSEIPADEQDEFIPKAFLNDLVEQVTQIPGLPGVSICRTHKPPTTTEAE